MRWLNHHHLQYFRLIAREGGLSAAARKLGITHSTLSAQLKELEGQLGRPLFERRAQRLVLTSFGEEVLGYAESIHRLGAQLLDLAEGTKAPEARRPLRVAVSGALPRSIVFGLLAPVLTSAQWGPVELLEHSPQELPQALLSGRVHFGLTDEPVVRSGLISQLLGKSGLHWYGTRELADRYRRRFPRSLESAPLVLPSAPRALRAAIDRWLIDHELRSPNLAATADDTAMLRVLGARGVGVFPVRDALRAEVEDLHHVEWIGALEGVSERYYAVALGRRGPDEALAKVVEHSQRRLRERASAVTRRA